jgi:hypothetical protein
LWIKHMTSVLITWTAPIAKSGSTTASNSSTLGKA